MATTITLSPQCAAILAELKVGPRTTLELMRATGITAMSARIHELRIALQIDGIAIDTALIGVRNRHKQRCHVARYSLRRVVGARRRTKATLRKSA